jgi:hypothetical protein
MANRISDLVTGGALYHSRPCCFHGVLMLRGSEDPVSVCLTGSPAADLQDRAFEFNIPANDGPATDEDRRRAKAFHAQQIGATGEMTAARETKTFDCSPEEYRRRSEEGNPPPARLETYLYLEWFSQNGRVVLEVPASHLTFLEWPEPKLSEEELAELLKSEEDLPDEDPSSSSAHAPEDMHEEDAEPETDFDADALPTGEAEEPEDYGLIPDELDRELARSARRLEREMSGMTEEENEALEECELMDEMIESEEGVLIPDAVEVLNLAAPATIATEEAAERALKTALTRLALYGIAFHVCEHCTLRDAYRIFVVKVCKRCKVYPKLRGTGWVQHFTTSDFCRECGCDPDED